MNAWSAPTATSRSGPQRQPSLTARFSTITVCHRRKSISAGASAPRRWANSSPFVAMAQSFSTR